MKARNFGSLSETREIRKAGGTADTYSREQLEQREERAVFSERVILSTHLLSSRRMTFHFPVLLCVSAPRPARRTHPLGRVDETNEMADGKTHPRTNIKALKEFKKKNCGMTYLIFFPDDEVNAACSMKF